MKISQSTVFSIIHVCTKRHPYGPVLLFVVDESQTTIILADIPHVYINPMLGNVNASCVCVQVYSWGDNEHGQQGNGSVLPNRKPQLVASLKDHHITKIACGSSHSVAFAAGTPASTGEFSPVSFPASQDSLGSSLVAGRLQDAEREQDEMKRPSLTKIILSLLTPAKQQEALGHMQTALQIAYARYTALSQVCCHPYIESCLPLIGK